ncbi:MAG TPA: hypothetical protein VEJ84_06415 [Acidimicrobiales bacterium]|nr:hypothetical protein [Acidimicrobiales bacterium]
MPLPVGVGRERSRRFSLLGAITALAVRRTAPAMVSSDVPFLGVRPVGVSVAVEAD